MPFPTTVLLIIFILSDHESRDAETVAVFQAFKHDSNPVKFILSRTWLGHNGIIALALALSRRCSLQELNLTDVDDDGAKALCCIDSFRLLWAEQWKNCTELSQCNAEHNSQKYYYYWFLPFVIGNTAENLIHILMAKFTLQEFSLSNRLDTAFNKYIVCKFLRMQLYPKPYSITLVFGVYLCVRCLLLRMELYP